MRSIRFYNKFKYEGNWLFSGPYFVGWDGLDPIVSFDPPDLPIKMKIVKLLFFAFGTFSLPVSDTTTGKALAADRGSLSEAIKNVEFRKNTEIIKAVERNEVMRMGVVNDANRKLEIAKINRDSWLTFNQIVHDSGIHSADLRYKLSLVLPSPIPPYQVTLAKEAKDHFVDQLNHKKLENDNYVKGSIKNNIVGEKGAVDLGALTFARAFIGNPPYPFEDGLKFRQ